MKFSQQQLVLVSTTQSKGFVLIRTVENEDVENEIKLCGTELKMLMLIFGKELEDSVIKTIPIVTNKESKCGDCRSYLILREEIEHVDSFANWCEKKSVNFDITPAEHFEENKANGIFTAIASCMSATKIHDIFPAFTAEVEKQMKGALLLLTLDRENTYSLFRGQTRNNWWSIQAR